MQTAAHFIAALLLMHAAAWSTAAAASEADPAEPATVAVDRLDGDTPAAEPPASPWTGTAAPVPGANMDLPATPPTSGEKPAAKAPAKPAIPTPRESPALAQKPLPTPAAPAAPLMALAVLEQRLKDTPAIGFLTKLTLKNQVDDLVNRMRNHHDGNGGHTLAQLRLSYDQLLTKVLGLLKDGDPVLARDILASREAIWVVLTDPVRFAKL